MDMAWKGIKGFLKIARKVYKSFIITAFQQISH